MSSASPRILPLSPADSTGVHELVQWAFGFSVKEDEPHSPFVGIPWDRAFGAWLDEPRRLAGFHAVHSFDLPVPGGHLPAAGMSWVAVHPQDRRRGVATAMLRHHLEDTHRRGTEPVSMLFASEPGIYGRFGYGVAATEVNLTMGRGTPLREVPGCDDLDVRFARADIALHAEMLNACYEEARRNRPGCVDRSTPEVRAQVLEDPAWRHLLSAEVLRLLTVHDRDDALRGYALFRRWSGGPEAGSVEVVEATALDLPAYRTVWARLLDLDLTRRVKTPRLAVDDPLLHLIPDVPSAEPRLGHNIWCRLVDVPAALAGRRYAAPVDAVLEIADELCPWNAGRWHLTGDRTGARCEPTTTDPQVSLEVADLGRLYLGGTPLNALADAGVARVHDADAAPVISTAFGWHTAPLCPWMF